MSPDHIFTLCSSNINFNIILLSVSSLLPLGFSTNILYGFLTTPMHATCHTHHILLNLSSWWGVKTMKILSPKQFSKLSYYFLDRSKYFLQHPLLERSIFFPARPRFIHVRNSGTIIVYVFQNWSFYIEIGRKYYTVTWMVTTILEYKSALNFLAIATSICYWHSKISELNFYIITLSSFLFMGHGPRTCC